MRILKNLIKRQAGYLLLEATLALSVAAGLMTYYIRERADRLTEDMAKAHGEQMRMISQALDRYIIDNHNVLTAAANVACCTVDPDGAGPLPAVNTPVANKLVPTPAELVNLGLLPAGANAAPIFGGGYNIILGLTNDAGNACVPGVDCARVRGMVLTNAPIMINGQINANVIGRALQTIGINGGAVGLANTPQNVVTGLNGAWTLGQAQGLPAGTPVGTMAVQVGWEWDPVNNRYLRRDGTLPMTGNLNMGARNINNANEVSVLSLTTPNASTPISVARAVNMNNNDITGA
jgi:hypothetical protein